MHDAGLSLERIGDYVGHGSTYTEGHEQEAARMLDGTRRGWNRSAAMMRDHLPEIELRAGEPGRRWDRNVPVSKDR